MRLHQPTCAYRRRRDRQAAHPSPVSGRAIYLKDVPVQYTGCFRFRIPRQQHYLETVKQKCREGNAALLYASSSFAVIPTLVVLVNNTRRSGKSLADILCISSSVKAVSARGAVLLRLVHRPLKFGHLCHKRGKRELSAVKLSSKPQIARCPTSC